jgi:hypothetical protein
MKLDTESKMKFDSSIGTEDRFTIRKWFQRFIDFCNTGDVESLMVFFAPNCEFTGWSRRPMDCEQLIAYFERRNMSDVNYCVRYPELEFRLRGGIYRVTGSFEEYRNGALCMEGSVDIRITQPSRVYQLVGHTFYPRLIVRDDAT